MHYFVFIFSSALLWQQYRGGQRVRTAIELGIGSLIALADGAVMHVLDALFKIMVSCPLLTFPEVVHSMPTDLDPVPTDLTPTSSASLA